MAVQEEGWPEAWKESFNNDSAEFWGWRINLGYTYAYQRRFRETVSLVERHLPRGSSVVDIAAGQGNLTLRLAELGFPVCWNDIRGELEGYVRLKHETGEVEYVPGNAFEVLQGRRFRAVVANEVIEHVAHPDELLEKLADLCEPGGLVFLSTPNGGYFHTGLPTFSEITDPVLLERHQFQPGSEGHLFLLTNRELVDLSAKAGLSVVELRNFTSPLLAGDFRLRKLLRFLPEWLVRGANSVVERLPARFRSRYLMHTCVVLRAPLVAQP